jgi:hypothetical protein
METKQEALEEFKNVKKSAWATKIILSSIHILFYVSAILFIFYILINMVGEM